MAWPRSTSQDCWKTKLRQVRDGHLPDLNESDCLAQKALLLGILIPDLESAPFAVEHGDLSQDNIIVDTEWNIQG